MTAHTWVNTARDDRKVCVDCGTARWVRCMLSAFEQFLYRTPGDAQWSSKRPDCAAVAADKMRTDGAA